MSLAIRGIGWVTPLGSDLQETYRRLQAGELAEAAPFAGRQNAWHFPLPASLVASVARIPRIRRSSVITHYSLAAGLAAMEAAGFPSAPGGEAWEPEMARRTAVIFAICSGGVHYTRRLYEKIVAEGAAGASPLLFPETVYNAPASHLAAQLGLDGMSYSVVGDASVGLTALGFAEELLTCHPELEQCVVVGSEESDWILHEGYQTWRLCAREPNVRLHQQPPAGMLLGEAAAALVVTRPAPGSGLPHLRVATSSYPQRRHALQALDAAWDAMGGDTPLPCDLVVGSANGTWVDRVESEWLARHLPGVAASFPKGQIGDPLGAAALVQVALGALALEAGDAKEGVAITALGLNQQAGVAWVGR